MGMTQLLGVGFLTLCSSGRLITVTEFLLSVGSEDLTRQSFLYCYKYGSASHKQESSDQIAISSLVFNKQSFLCWVDSCQEHRDLGLCADMIRDSQPQKGIIQLC